MVPGSFYANRGSIFGYSEEYGRDEDGDLIFHAGQDFPWRDGTSIPFPAGSGRVSVVGVGADAGHYASIIVNGQYHQFYHQNQRPPLEVGQLMQFGDTVGYVGNTGKSYGDHLHYAVSNSPYPGPHGNRVDPWPIIQEMLAANGASTAGVGYETYPEEEDMNSEQNDKLDAIYSALWNGGTNTVDGVPMKYSYGALHMDYANQVLIARIINQVSALQAAVTAQAAAAGGDPTLITKAITDAVGKLKVPTVAEIDAALSDNFSHIGDAQLDAIAARVLDAQAARLAK